MRKDQRWEIFAVRRGWLTTLTLSGWIAADEHLHDRTSRLLQPEQSGLHNASGPPPGLAVKPATPDAYVVQGGGLFIRRPVLVAVRRVRVWGPGAADLEDCIRRVHPWLPLE